MKLIIPIADSDKPLITSFVSVLKHWGKQKGHDCVVITDYGEKNNIQAEYVYNEVKDLYDNCHLYIDEQFSPTGWPQGPNFYWHCTIEHLKLSDNKEPWFWIESDAYPLKKNYMDILEKEYIDSKKPFCGSITKTYNTVLTKNLTSLEEPVEIPHHEHTTGIAIYPARVDQHIDSWQYVNDTKIAFDSFCQYEMVPLTKHSEIFLQCYRSGSYRIENKSLKYHSRIKKKEMIKKLEDHHVIHHGCKDNTMPILILTNQI